MDTLITIIIPVHNSSRTVCRCVDSITSSSYKNIEIIIVNDRSTDDTFLIIQKLAAKDSRIRFFSTEGLVGGLSCARNVGIRNAKGSFLTFVDSDDYVEQNIYGKVVKVLDDFSPDLLDFNFYFDTDGNISKHGENLILKDTLLDRMYLESFVFPDLVNVSSKKDYFIENYVWNKFYKTGILQKYIIEFDEKRKKWEDRHFVIRYCQYVYTFYSMSDFGCYYCLNSNVSSLSKSNDPYLLNTVVSSYEDYKQIFGYLYNFEGAYSVNYYCRLLIDVMYGQIESFGADRVFILGNLKSVFSRESIVSLFAKYKPTTKYERKIKSHVNDHNYNDLLTTVVQEIRSRKIKKRLSVYANFIKTVIFI